MDNAIFQAILQEVKRAENKHPKWPTDILHAASIVAEEMGELTRASLQFAFEGGGIEEAREEAIQVAATAIRFLSALNEHGYYPKKYFDSLKPLKEYFSGLCLSEELQHLIGEYQVSFGNEFCSCGCGDGPNHELGAGNCFRKRAEGSLIPSAFHKHNGVWFCVVNDYTITVYTLTHQRMYSLHSNGNWSLPKSEESINSLYTTNQFS